ncbi:MAG: hypothetical protein AB7Q29_05690 [Vicinamibacterales bacterium]
MRSCGYRAVSFADGVVGVEWAGAAARQSVDVAFARLPDDDDRLPELTLRVGSASDPSLLTLFAGPRCLYRGTSIGACAHLLVQTSLDSLIARSSRGIVVHAALLGREGAGVLLPGPTGSGKTMLCAWLARRGLAYLSDEAAYLPADATYLPTDRSSADGFARPLCFKGPWAEPLGLPGEDVHAEWIADGVSLVSPHQLNATPAADAVVPKLIVFPTFRHGADLAITRLTPARTAVRLIETVANWRNLRDHGVGQVTSLARAVPAYQLTYGAFAQLDPLWSIVAAVH